MHFNNCIYCIFFICSLIVNYIILINNVIINLMEINKYCGSMNIYLLINIIINFIIPIFLIILIILYCKNIFIDIILLKIIFFINFLINIWAIINLTKLDCLTSNLLNFMFYYFALINLLNSIVIFFNILYKQRLQVYNYL
jgi:hypothetical protein